MLLKKYLFLPFILLITFKITLRECTLNHMYILIVNVIKCLICTLRGKKIYFLRRGKYIETASIEERQPLRPIIIKNSLLDPYHITFSKRLMNNTCNNMLYNRITKKNWIIIDWKKNFFVFVLCKRCYVYYFYMRFIFIFRYYNIYK